MPMEKTAMIYCYGNSICSYSQSSSALICLSHVKPLCHCLMDEVYRQENFDCKGHVAVKMMVHVIIVHADLWT